ncbi:MAG: PPOX class F420-dependent enzyme [Gammaproteobacteria bacterium]|nr:PPOX class F420-dependent enzyme [Gammaproteobacteria bacterium]
MGRNQLSSAKYLSFATFRKNGKAVATPVWFAEEASVFYIFSASDAGKVKRLRHSGRSRIAACSATGKLMGEWVDTLAELIPDRDGEKEALAALRRKYGWQMWTTDFLSKLSGKIDKRAYIRVRVQSEAPSGQMNHG